MNGKMEKESNGEEIGVLIYGIVLMLITGFGGYYITKEGGYSLNEKVKEKESKLIQKQEELYHVDGMGDGSYDDFKSMDRWFNEREKCRGVWVKKG